MAEGSSFEKLLRGSVEANLHFYETLTRATAEYVEELARIWSEADIPTVAASMDRDWKTRTGGEPAQTATRRREAEDTGRRGPPALVLEGGAGEVARAEFAVSNDLRREVEAEVVTSDLRGPRDEEVDAELRAEPAEVVLAPGERIAVTVEAMITEAFTEGVGYRGEITVPGLSRQTVPLVVRRREDGEDGAEASDVAREKDGS